MAQESLEAHVLGLAPIDMVAGVVGFDKRVLLSCSGNSSGEWTRDSA